MERPATLYARFAAPPALGRPQRRFDPTLTHGRWTRVLRACADAPLTPGDIHRAVRRYGPERSGRVEKAMTRRVVSRLLHLGLLDRQDGRYAASAAGRRAMADVAVFDRREAA
jgi:hypothetical protein